MILLFYPCNEVLPWDMRLLIGTGVECWFGHTWRPWSLPWPWDSAWVTLLRGRLISLRGLVISLLLWRHRLQSFKTPNGWHFFSLKQRKKQSSQKKKKVACVLAMVKQCMMSKWFSWNWQTHHTLTKQGHWWMQFNNTDSTILCGRLPGERSRHPLDREKEAASISIFPIFIPRDRKLNKGTAVWNHYQTISLQVFIAFLLENLLACKLI